MPPSSDKPLDASNLGSALRWLREQRKISVAEVARRMHKTSSQIQKIERARLPSMAIIHRFLEAIESSPIELMEAIDAVSARNAACLATLETDDLRQELDLPPLPEGDPLEPYLSWRRSSWRSTSRAPSGPKLSRLGLFAPYHQINGLLMLRLTTLMDRLRLGLNVGIDVRTTIACLGALATLARPVMRSDEELDELEREQVAKHSATFDDPYEDFEDDVDNEFRRDFGEELLDDLSFFDDPDDRAPASPKKPKK